MTKIPNKTRQPRKVTRSEETEPIFYKKWDYSKDPIFGPIVQSLDRKEKVENYSWENNRLVCKSLFCVPMDIAPEIIHQYHLFGHPGIAKLKSLLDRRYKFSLKQRDLYILCEKECKHCQVCQAVKPRQGRSPGTLDFCPIPEDIFSSLCMDFLEVPEIKDKQGNSWNYIFVIVCRSSGFIEAIPCNKRGLTAEIAAGLFLNTCVKFMGIPNEILTDQDHLITSHFFTTLCELTGIEQHSSIIYRPQGNGRAEAAVKAVVSMLRRTVTALNCKWLTALPWALNQINSLPGLLLDYSPYKIVFGREPICVGDIPSTLRTRTSVSCEEWFEKLQKLRKDVQQKVTSIHEKLSTQFRNEHPRHIYAKGDLVWIRNGPGDEFNKLDPLWTGPCEILHQYGNTGRYQVALPQGSEDVHMERFKPYLPPNNRRAIPFHYFKPQPKLPETDTYIVDKIVDYRVKKGIQQWRIRWRGYGEEEDTWAPARNFVGYIQSDWKRWNKEHKIIVPLETIN
jgi:transposase InsO family protein